MSVKSNADDQTSKGSDPVSQHENNVEGTELAPMSDATLQDLPTELLEGILLEVVVVEVKDMKLVKRLWKDKADLVMTRLGSVCLRWKSVVGTDFFRHEVHRILEETAEQPNRLEILLRSPIPRSIFRVVAIGNELFMLCRPKHRQPFIQIRDRKNMVKVKNVIQLPGIIPVDMAACSLSNCLYVLSKDQSHCRSVFRITKDNEEEHQFRISPWITNLSYPDGMLLFVSVSGNLIILSHKNIPKPSLASIYSANGFLQHEIVLSKDVIGFVGAFGAIEKSNGNLVLATYCHDYDYVTELKEVDMSGGLVREYRSSVFGGVAAADIYGRIAIIGQGKESEILDSEFNLFIATDPEPRDYNLHIPYGMHYNRDRKEIVRVVEIASNTRNRVLAILGFAKE